MKATPEDVAKPVWAFATLVVEPASMKATPEDVAKSGVPIPLPGGMDVPQ